MQRRGSVYPEIISNNRRAVGTARKLEAFVRCEATKLILDKYGDHLEDRDFS